MRKIAYLLFLLPFMLVACHDNDSAEPQVEWVDLGLSVDWANCNLGAEAPQDYGYYYSWGDLAPKIGYSQDNTPTYGQPIDTISGHPDYDAATAMLGAPSRMPTKEEFEELMDHCNVVDSTYQGVRGYYFISKLNQNHIFLPTCGRMFGTVPYHNGSRCCYWSGTPYISPDDDTSAYKNTFAYGMSIYSDFLAMKLYGRDNGHSIRAVREK